MAYTFLLIFYICVSNGDEFQPCFEGEAWAFSCFQAERAVREGLREGYHIDIIECRRLR